MATARLTADERRELAAILAEAERRGLVPPQPVRSWLETVTPRWNWSWPHLRYVQDHLDRVTTGDIKRLMLFLPPRHGKSEMTTVRYPVYRLEKNPYLRVIVGAYNQTLANKFSRKARRLAEGRLALSDERTAVEDWETTKGGGMRAVGVGGGVTGQGGDLVIIDDPIKNREEADSEAYRERVWDWYTDDLYTRLEPGAALVLIMTRWHEDDLAGRILASDDAPNWTVVKLPAEAEEDDPLGRKPGEALCRDRYDEAALAGIKNILHRSYYALYQQRPQPREGAMFHREWFQVAPKPVGARAVRWWDMAATEDGGDWTVGVKLSLGRDQLVYVEDVQRFRHAPGKRDRRIRQVVGMDGPSVPQWSGREPGAAGVTAAESFVRLLVGYAAHHRPETGSKETRAEPFASYAENGMVRMVRGDWNEAFLSELVSFPSGKHDDQVDAAAQAFSVLVKQPNLVGVHSLGTDEFSGPSAWTIE